MDSVKLTKRQREVLQAAAEGLLYSQENHVPFRMKTTTDYWIKGQGRTTHSTVEILRKAGLIKIVHTGIAFSFRHSYEATDDGRAVLAAWTAKRGEEE